MEINELHSWDLDYKDAVALQRELALQLIQRAVVIDRMRTVAGVDVSSARRAPTIHAAVVVLELESFAVVEEATSSVRISFPYIPGLLSFREGPAALAAFRRLRTPPDAVIFDGQGYAHPRRLGLAAHIGLWLGIPTVGCAKTRLIGEHDPAPRKRGGWSRLVDGGETIGAVLTAREGVKPVFVSRGHLCDLDSAIRIVLASCGRYRLPEPIRRAHALCNQVRRDSEE
jgi:deoxyribonuclease V